jgi:hypothetical protein
MLFAHELLSVSGAVLQPSDQRVKTDITPLDPAQQLANVRAMRLYRYRLSDDWAETCGRLGNDVSACACLWFCLSAYAWLCLL